MNRRPCISGFAWEKAEADGYHLNRKDAGAARLGKGITGRGVLFSKLLLPSEVLGKILVYHWTARVLSP